MKIMIYLCAFFFCIATTCFAQEMRTPVLTITSIDSLMMDRFVMNLRFETKFYDSLIMRSSGVSMSWHLLPEESSELISGFARGRVFPQSCPVTITTSASTFARVVPVEFASLPTRSRFFLRIYVALASGSVSLMGATNTLEVNLPQRSVSPTIPQLLPPISIRPQAFTILWNKVFGTNTRIDTTLYLVEVDTSDLFTAPRVFTTRDTSQVIAGLRPATRYFYRVKARNSAGESRFSSSTSYSTLKANANYAIDANPDIFIRTFWNTDILYSYNSNRMLSRHQGDSLAALLYNAKVPFDSIFFRVASLCSPQSPSLGRSYFNVVTRQRNDSLMLRLGFETIGAQIFREPCCPTREDILYHSFSPQTSVRELPSFEGLKLTTPAPNPASSETTLEFTLPNDATVSVRIFDVLGNIIAQPLGATPLSKGEHSLRINLASLPSGSYRIRLDALSTKGNNMVQTHLLIMK